jgi:hypothetical protein
VQQPTPRWHRCQSAGSGFSDLEPAKASNAVSSLCRRPPTQEWAMVPWTGMPKSLPARKVAVDAWGQLQDRRLQKTTTALACSWRSSTRGRPRGIERCPHPLGKAVKNWCQRRPAAILRTPRVTNSGARVPLGSLPRTQEPAPASRTWADRYQTSRDPRPASRQNWSDCPHRFRAIADRMKAALAQLGIRNFNPKLKRAPDRAEATPRKTSDNPSNRSSVGGHFSAWSAERRPNRFIDQDQCAVERGRYCSMRRQRCASFSTLREVLMPNVRPAIP